MLIKIKKSLGRHLLNIPGWRTSRKIVVIESDDWGTVRMSSKEAFQSLLKKGYPVDKCPYNTFDALESNKDLNQLFDVLSSVKDSQANPAILTINNIVGNPDFSKIHEANFQQYYYEPFTETLKKYPEHDQVMDLYRQGIKEKLVQPQFHGREHLQVERWMTVLQNSDKAARDVFDWGIFSPKISHQLDYPNEYMDAFDTDGQPVSPNQVKIVREGLTLFKHIWGFSSSSFIAPCYTWDPDLEPYLANMGVKYLQGIVYQRVPVFGVSFVYRSILHYQGQKNMHNQRYLIRNASFEPTILPNMNWVDDCLHKISTAFRWGKPAIIGSHRLNYMGYLEPSNREKNLSLLRDLLNQIIAKWPEVEFMSTDQLGALMDQ